MKISKLFHYLYAIVLLLPVMVAPAFLIYSHRHTIDSNSVVVPENTIVDFNQLVDNGNFSTNSGWSLGDAVDNTLVVPISNTDVQTIRRSASFTVDHKILISFSVACDNPLNLNTLRIRYPFTSYLSIENDTNFQSIGVIGPSSSGQTYVGIQAQLNNADLTTLQLRNFEAFDLTQMFGSGNEPTIEEFNTYFPNDYYDYTLSKRMLLKNTSTVTYNDTDIGSQFVYSLYNVTNNYFNFNNVFGFGNLQDWFLLNIFGGNAPLGFFLVWSYLLYWLFVSIFWLLFDVFMYVPQLVHRWIDKARIE